MECKDICNLGCAYLDNEMEPETKEFFERHLASCDGCRKEIEACRFVKILIQERIPRVKVPDVLKIKVMMELARAEEYRETGIDVIDLLLWGSHIAQLYDGRDEISEVVVPYMTKGLEQNERCLWIVSDISEIEARDAIVNVLPNVESYLDNRQLEILSYEDWYLVDGHFDGKLVLNAASEKCQDAISHGYSGLRVAGSTCWLDRNDWNSFIDYEKSMNNAMSDKKLLAVCSYNQRSCAKDKISDVVNTHKYVLCKSDHFWKLKSPDF